jgi:hypothetical protein
VTLQTLMACTLVLTALFDRPKVKKARFRQLLEALPATIPMALQFLTVMIHSVFRCAKGES